MFRPFFCCLFSPPACRDLTVLHQAMKGKTILITGASFGIGEATALLLAKAGAKVILLARTEEKLQALTHKICAQGGQAVYYCLDLYQTEQVAPLIRQIYREHPRIDAVVSNAGKSIRRPTLQSVQRQDLERMLAVNFSSPAALLLELLPQMIAQGGGVVVNVSTASVGPPGVPRWAGYQGSKVGFELWLRSLANEVRLLQVRVASVYMPLVRTRMITPTKMYDRVPALTPLEAAQVVAFALVHPVERVAPWWLRFVDLLVWLMPRVIDRVLSRLEGIEQRYEACKRS